MYIAFGLSYNNMSKFSDVVNLGDFLVVYKPTVRYVGDFFILQNSVTVWS